MFLKSGQDLITLHDKWLKIALSTEKIKRETAKESVERLYVSAGFDKPTVLFFDSPAACLMAKIILQEVSYSFLKGYHQWNLLLDMHIKEVFHRFRNYFPEKFKSLFEDQLKTQCKYPPKNFHKEHLESPLYFKLCNDLIRQMFDGLSHQDFNTEMIFKKLYNPLEKLLAFGFTQKLYDQLPSQLSERYYISGSWDGYWLSVFEYVKKNGVEYKNSEQFDAYLNYSKSCGITYPYQNIAFVSDRPIKININKFNLLHCKDDYAMQFNDCYGFCAWHGTPIYNKWVIQKSLDVQSAVSCLDDAERHAACEILGWHNILNNFENNIIDRHHGSSIYELIEAEIPPLIGKKKFLRMNTGLPVEKVYPVPSDIIQVEQAKSWVSFINRKLH